MICPCKSRIDCGGDDSPLAGFNSDAADCCTKIGVQYGIGGLLPALGSNWVNSNCVAFAEACDQDTADSLALSDYMHCVALNNRTPPAFDFVDPPDVPTPWDVDVFGNTVQTCSSLCPDGLLFTFTVKEDQFFALSQLQADNMAHSFACKNLAINQVCMGSLIPSECCVNQSYTANIAATGTFTPFQFSLVSGSIPPGMSFTQVSAAAGKLSGTPSTAGTFQFSIQATDSHGNFMRKAYTLNVISISTGAIPPATVGTPYSFDFAMSGTLSGDAQWSIASGSLPDGLTMDSDGSITGTPTVAGSTSFTVALIDGTVNCQKAFSVSVSGSVGPVVCVTEGASVNVTAITSLGVTPTNDAATRRAVAYDPSGPTLRFVNTQTNAVIQTVPLGAALSADNGCFATSTKTFFFVSGTDLAVYDADGNFIINIALPSGGNTPCYSPVQDRVYVNYDAGLGDRFAVINPNTNTIVLTLTPSVATGVAGLIYFPESVAARVGNVWQVFNLPAGTHQGFIDLNPGGTTPAFGYAASTGKIFVGAFNGITFSAEVWEVDPTTLAVEQVYVMANPFDSVFAISYNPVTGAVIVTSNRSTDADLTVIDPNAHAIVCSLQAGDTEGAGMAIDYVSGVIYKADDVNGALVMFS